MHFYVEKNFEKQISFAKSKLSKTKKKYKNSFLSVYVRNNVCLLNVSEHKRFC